MTGRRFKRFEQSALKQVKQSFEFILQGLISDKKTCLFKERQVLQLFQAKPISFSF
jgi:hypothetical protein